jgi:hypothetical protein
MIRLLRNSVIVLITLLQLVAPLVHAHASSTQSFAAGLHVPGLESFNPHEKISGAYAKRSHADCCGILVDIGCGLKQSKIAADFPPILPNAQDIVPISADYVTADIGFSPPTFSFPNQTALLPIAPRAPPFPAYTI